MSKGTRSAKNQDCTVRIPGVCNFDPATTVLAHINGVRFGHGVAIKTKFGAWACSACHDVLDGRVKSNFSREAIKLMHYEGCFETMDKLGIGIER